MAEIQVRERLKHDLPWLGAVFGIYLSYWFVKNFGLGVDAHAYWLAARGTLYTGPPATYDAFLYSPAFIQLIWPIAQFDWPIFSAIWMCASFATFAYLLWPLGWRLAVPFLIMCLPEVLMGNINWMFALVVAFGIRRPSLWAFPFFTKITPAIGPIWFLARGDWRRVGISALAAAVVFGLSFLLNPAGWLEWFEFLQAHLSMAATNVGGVFAPPAVRVPIAVLVVIFGARTNKFWAIPLAMVLAAPVHSIGNLAIFAGLPRLLASGEKSNA